jgi:hypothetical protein
MELPRVMNRRLKIVLAAAIAVVAIAALVMWMSTPGKPPANLDLARAKASEKGLYNVAIEPEAGSFKQGEMHAWVISLTDASKASVDDAKFEIDGGMPQHHHGLSTSPEVTTQLGGGKYRLEGVKFTMSGWWELRLAIASAAGSDKVTFNFVLQ